MGNRRNDARGEKQVGAVFVVALARRAILEERTLQAQLPGYATYMTEVKYRLIPYIW